MSEELQMRDLQMKGLTEKLSVLLSHVDKSKTKDRDMMDINSRLKEFSMALDAAYIDLRHLGPNHPNRSEFKVSLREHKNALKEFRAQMEAKKSNLVKDELLDGGEENNGEDKETAEGLMKHGLDTQQKSKDSLERTLRTVNETKIIGQDVNAKLEANTEQIVGIYDKIEQIESTLQRSTKIIKRIARKMATDKYIWVIAFLVFAAIVFILVWKNIPHGSSSSSSSTTPSASGAAVFAPVESDFDFRDDNNNNKNNIPLDPLSGSLLNPSVHSSSPSFSFASDLQTPPPTESSTSSSSSSSSILSSVSSILLRLSSFSLSPSSSSSNLDSNQLVLLK